MLISEFIGTDHLLSHLHGVHCCFYISCLRNILRLKGNEFDIHPNYSNVSSPISQTTNLFGGRRRHLDGLVLGVDVVQEVEDAAGVVGHAVVGPRLEVEVVDSPLVLLE